VMIYRDATESMTERIRYWEGIAESTNDRDTRMRALRWALAWRRLQLRVLKVKVELRLKTTLRGVELWGWVEDVKDTGGQTGAISNTTQRTKGTLDRALLEDLGKTRREIEWTTEKTMQFLEKVRQYSVQDPYWSEELFGWFWWDDGYFFTHSSGTLIRRLDGSVGRIGGGNDVGSGCEGLGSRISLGKGIGG
jgi:hypothetical protein